MRVEQRAKILAGVQACADRGERARVGRGCEADGHAGFLDRLADRGDARGAAVRVEPERCRERMIAGIDPPAGEHQRPACKHHRLGALYHQEIGRCARAVADQDERRGGDGGLRGVGHSADMRGCEAVRYPNRDPGLVPGSR